ncbi:MAG: DNA-binding protein [Verrucomicrobiota bacterium]
MADLLLTDVSPALIAKLRQRATAHDRSIEDEAVNILAATPPIPQRTFLEHLLDPENADDSEIDLALQRDPDTTDRAPDFCE